MDEGEGDLIEGVAQWHLTAEGDKLKRALE